MNKLNQLTKLIARFHGADRTDVFADEGKIKTNSRVGYSYYIEYVINIYLHDFSSDFKLIVAELMRWIRINEPDQQINEIFEFEVEIINQDSSELAFALKVTEKVVVIEDNEGNLIIDTCEIAS